MDEQGGTIPHAGNAIDMNLLDELDEEAARLRAATDAAARQKSDIERIFHDQLVPGMELLKDFLDRLTANLKLLKPRTVMRYPVPGYGEISAHAEHDYVIEQTRNPSSRTLTLTFSCAIASNECPLVEVHGSARVRSLAGLFHRYRISGMSTPQKDASGEVTSAGFRARGRIAQRALFHVDTEHPHLRMSFENIDGLGTTMKTVAVERFDSALFDEIGRYLMGEPNSLFREELPASYRRQLRQKVQHEQLKRRWESQAAATSAAAREEKEAAERTLQGRLARLRVRAALANRSLRTRARDLAAYLRGAARRVERKYRG
jgi:hypothetical protein